MSKDPVLFTPWVDVVKELPHCDYCDGEGEYQPPADVFCGLVRAPRKSDCSFCNRLIDLKPPLFTISHCDHGVPLQEYCAKCKRHAFLEEANKEILGAIFGVSPDRMK